jgi:hypothetical protein
MYEYDRNPSDNTLLLLIILRMSMWLSMHMPLRSGIDARLVLLRYYQNDADI